MARPKETLKEKQARLKESCIVWAESLFKYELICRAVGIDVKTLINWRKDDVEFSNRLEQARVVFLNKNMRKAKPEFLLERLDPENFKQRTENETKIILPKPIMDVSDAVRTDDSNQEG